jgi:L-serine dehydratase
MNYQPSIFNDVFGPVMRGPSSSHSAAALRIGRICRDLMNGDPGRVHVQYDRKDALATTHDSQGSDMGMIGGLLGLEPDDARLSNPYQALRGSQIEVEFSVTDTGRDLPNLYVVTLKNREEQLEVVAVSTGGGMIEVKEIDRLEISIHGDFHEILIYSDDRSFLSQLQLETKWAEQANLTEKGTPFLQIKSIQPPDASWLDKLKSHPSVIRIRSINPVLPVVSPNVTLPFTSSSQLLDKHLSKPLPAWEWAVSYESTRSGMTPEKTFQMMDRLYEIMRNSINEGMAGTNYPDRILGAQSIRYREYRENGKLAGGEVLHNITQYVSAIMEVKSSMGIIVAAPTAGSCGTFPGAVLGVADALGKSRSEIVKALMAGSLVGIFIATASTFSAEIGGCQAECGSAAGMAAASITALLGGNLEQAMAAASLALQNSLGMICDPIAARVEAPCLGKNINSALNALSCANMALAGYDPLIPLDEVIETMDRVGKSLPSELRCTALGGLSITPAARKLEKRMKK